uniref:Uncharacterized protein n=1 Tax=Tetranychus urticae TaxID=32264 RepID=T1KF05_TETUR
MLLALKDQTDHQSFGPLFWQDVVLAHLQHSSLIRLMLSRLVYKF